MSPRVATILIGAFGLAAAAFCYFLMGPAGVEFAVVGLVIAVACAAIGIIAPAVMGKGKKR